MSIQHWTIEFDGERSWEVSRGRKRRKTLPDYTTAFAWLRRERAKMAADGVTEKDLGRVFCVEDDGYRVDITRQFAPRR